MRCFKTRKILLAVLSLAMVPSVAMAAPRRLNADESKETLSLLRNRMQANFEQIRTWQGEWFYREQMTLRKVEDATLRDALGLPATADEIVQTNEGMLDFAFDRLQNKLIIHTHSSTPEFNEGEAGPGIKVQSATIPDRIQIFNSNEYWCAEDVRFDKDDLPIERIGYLAPLSSVNRDAGLGGLMRPLQLYSYDGLRPYWESLTFLLDHLEMLAPEDELEHSSPASQMGLRFWVYEMRGSAPRLYLVIVVGPKGSGNPTIIRQDLLFDESIGFNCMLVTETTDGVKSGDQATFYVQQQNIFVPHQLSRTYYDQRGRVRMTREVTLKKTKVNETMAEDCFSLSKLGLRDGERVIDKVNGHNMIYVSGHLESQPSP